MELGRVGAGNELVRTRGVAGEGGERGGSEGKLRHACMSEYRTRGVRGCF